MIHQAGGKAATAGFRFTVYRGRAGNELRSRGEIVRDDFLSHVAPLGWENITSTALPPFGATARRSPATSARRRPDCLAFSRLAAYPRARQRNRRPAPDIQALSRSKNLQAAALLATPFAPHLGAPYTVSVKAFLASLVERIALTVILAVAAVLGWFGALLGAWFCSLRPSCPYHYCRTSPDRRPFGSGPSWCRMRKSPARLWPTERGYRHDPRVIGTMAAHIVLPWIHRAFSLMKRWSLGTHHGLRPKHVDTYLNVPSSDPTVLAQTAAIYGVLRGSRSIGAKIDDLVAQRVARPPRTFKISREASGSYRETTPCSGRSQGARAARCRAAMLLRKTNAADSAEKSPSIEVCRAAIGTLGKREMAPPTFDSLSCIKVDTSRKATVSYFNAMQASCR